MASSSGRRRDESHLDPRFLGHELRLSLKAAVLHERARTKARRKELQELWLSFRERLLQTVCAARNTPCICEVCMGLGAGSTHQRQIKWKVVIQLEGAKKYFDYIDEFCQKIDDQLSYLLSPKSNFADAYSILRDESGLRLNVASSREDFATVDYCTTQPLNKGIASAGSLRMENICYDLYKEKDRHSSLPQRLRKLEGPLKAKRKLHAFEDAHLQFKRLRKNDENDKGEIFHPKKPEDYVEWIWNKMSRPLGNYVTSFAKIPGGGVIYYGVEELRDRRGYRAEGLPLTGWNADIKMGILEKIRKKMLWIQRDLGSEYGYEELSPADILCKGDPGAPPEKIRFDVDFIPVTVPASRSQSTGRKREGRGRNPTPPKQDRYVLEVRVASFNGVVFHDPQGPKAYKMKKTGETFKPVRMEKAEWLKRMRDHGWCTLHKVSKEVECYQCRAAGRRN